MFKTIINFLLLTMGLFMHCISNGQSLHHQMLSSQGATIQLPSGFIITQSVGQNSVSSNLKESTRGIRFIEGFQQPFLMNIAKSKSFENFNLIVFPNPFTDYIKFKLPNYSFDSELKISIYDGMGREVFQKIVSQPTENNSLDLNQLQSAIYYLKILYKNQIYASKIFKL